MKHCNSSSKKNDNVGSCPHLLKFDASVSLVADHLQNGKFVVVRHMTLSYIISGPWSS